MTETIPPRIVIGDFFITRGETPGCVWIGRTNGEGGDFPIVNFEETIENFYQEHF